MAAGVAADVAWDKRLLVCLLVWLVMVLRESHAGIRLLRSREGGALRGAIVPIATKEYLAWRGTCRPFS